MIWRGPKSLPSSAAPRESSRLSVDLQSSSAAVSGHAYDVDEVPLLDDSPGQNYPAPALNPPLDGAMSPEKTQKSPSFDSLNEFSDDTDMVQFMDEFERQQQSGWDTDKRLSLAQALMRSSISTTVMQTVSTPINVRSHSRHLKFFH